MIRVIIESPFRGETEEIAERNLEYLRRCIKDSLDKGEAPFASHGFYPLVLDDAKPKERRLGIKAGFAWARMATLVAVYTDYGITEGMELGIKNAESQYLYTKYRTIGKNPSEEGGD